MRGAGVKLVDDYGVGGEKGVTLNSILVISKSYSTYMLRLTVKLVSKEAR